MWTKIMPVAGEWLQWPTARKAHLVMLSASGLPVTACGGVISGDSDNAAPGKPKCKTCQRLGPHYERYYASIPALNGGRYVQTEGWWWRVELEAGE